MRWRWLRRPPSFRRMVEVHVGLADNIVRHALERASPRPPPSARIIADLWWSYGQVCNGGFAQLVSNDDGPARLPAYLDAHLAIGATAAAAAVEAAIAIAEGDRVMVDELVAGPLFGDPRFERFAAPTWRYIGHKLEVTRCGIDYMLARDELWYQAAVEIAWRDHPSWFELGRDAALGNALLYDHAELLRRAIDAGVDVARYRCMGGNTALHDVADSKAGLVPILIAAGVPVDVANDRGERALHRAAAYGAANVQALIEHGATVDARDRHRETPLHRARGAATRVMLDAGADPHARSDIGTEPLHVAKDAESVEHLLAAGADPSVRARGGRTPLHFMASGCDAEGLRRVVAAGGALDARDARGRTPLHEASSRGNVEVLLELGAAVDARDERGRTPLMTVFTPEAVAALLAGGASVDAVDADGRMALHWPRFRAEILGILLAAGASLDRRDKHGRTPLEHARHARARTRAAEEHGDDASVDALEREALYCTADWLNALEALGSPAPISGAR